MDPSTDKRIILVVGGARSGKSSWALHYAEETYPSRVFLATAQIGDDEMAERVRLHQASRGPEWRLIEEPIDIDKALETDMAQVDVVLIDCLTIWLSNILLQKGRDAVDAHQSRLLAALSRRRQSVVMVSNEVGTGIVPEHPLAREFRDLAGTLNQKIAAVADTVVMTVAGIPVFIK